MKLLAIGDVVGERALAYLRRTLPEQRRLLGADLVISTARTSATFTASRLRRQKPCLKQALI